MPPAPHGPLPTARQLLWHEMEYYGFVHFTVNTFTDREWGMGDERPSDFTPSAFDADQIARTAREGGMAGLILTAKHHDGFCLWPSKFTEHSVKNSPWKNGAGDVVREMAEACRRQGLKFGVYLSPWDRNHPSYAKPEYIVYYRSQLRELLTNYGDIFTVWFDGANGGDGYYGGARERRRIDNKTYYDWPATWRLVRELQPMAVMFSDGGPDYRWVGNENGIAGDPCWATLDFGKMVRYPGCGSTGLNSGERPGTHWLPAECDVSIRPGWFYHASEDASVKTPAQLLDIYYKSVGRGACLNLNLPPDRRGILHENDVRSLRDFKRLLDATFARNLIADARINASNIRGGNPQGMFTPRHLADGKRDTYWATDDGVTTPELIVEFPRETTFNVVDLREHLPLGQRIDAFAIDYWKDERWQPFAAGTSIGNRRLLRAAPVTTTRARVRITQAPVAPALSELGFYAEPKQLDPPTIARDRHGSIALQASSAACELRYTLDGSVPTTQSPLFAEPFPLPLGGTVTARAFSLPEGTAGEISKKRFGVSRAKWRIVSPAAPQGSKWLPRYAIDESPATVWRDTANVPTAITVDLGQPHPLAAITYLPPTDAVGAIDRCECHTSIDGKSWSASAPSVEFGNLRANPIEQRVSLPEATVARYVRFTALRTLDGEPPAIADLGVVLR